MSLKQAAGYLTQRLDALAFEENVDKEVKVDIYKFSQLSRRLPEAVLQRKDRNNVACRCKTCTVRCLGQKQLIKCNLVLLNAASQRSLSIAASALQDQLN